ncbi:MAG: RIO1 family regulatory kinase/ATPase [Thermoprotei archaeon]
MVKIGLIYKQLTDRDFRVLAALEKNIGKYEYVPLEVIEKTAKIPETHIVLSLSKLHRLKLVKRVTVAGTKAFRLTYLGLDMLALRALVKMNVLEAIGDRIGVGKESDIFKGLAPGGKEVIVKFLRIGRTSFRRTRIVRSWGEDPRFTWFHQSKVAAEREFKALRELYSVEAAVPYPLAYNRHVVVTEFINGVELYTRPDLEDPKRVLDVILETLRKAYVEVGIIHGDLSEYNVLVDVENNMPYIIDWPQYVYREDPSAEQLLRRDVEYIIRFFKKNYGVEVSVEDALKYVRGENG